MILTTTINSIFSLFIWILNIQILGVEAFPRVWDNYDGVFQAINAAVNLLFGTIEWVDFFFPLATVVNLFELEVLMWTGFITFRILVMLLPIKK